MSADTSENAAKGTMLCIGHGNYSNVPPYIIELYNMQFATLSRQFSREAGYIIKVGDLVDITSFYLEITQSILALYSVGLDDKTTGLKLYTLLLNQHIHSVVHVSDANIAGITIEERELIEHMANRLADRSYEITKFDQRKLLMDDMKTSTIRLEDQFVEQIKAFQTKYMSFRPGEITEGWEMRDRIVGYPCGLGLDEIISCLKKFEYFSIKYKHEDFTFLFHVNKNALKYEIAHATKFVQYDNTPALKEGFLSNKHFMVMHLKCPDAKCGTPKSTQNCSDQTLQFGKIVSDVISKLHIFIRSVCVDEDLNEDHIRIRNSETERFGNKYEVEPTERFKYYDLALAEGTNIILGACSGFDAVVDAAFS